MNTLNGNEKDTASILDFRPYCHYPACGKLIPEYTEFGRKKTNSRLQGQKYCTPSCARLHYFEQQHAKEANLIKGQEILDKFIYGGYTCRDHSDH